MKDKIIEKLTELGIEDSKGITEDIAKIVGLYTVPKDTFNDTNTKFKNEVSLRESAEAERDTYKSQLDNANSKTSEFDKILKANEELTMKVNEMEARRVFEKAHISEERIKELLPKVVSKDSKATIELSESIANMLEVSKEETKKQIEDDIIKDTPKPDVKDNGNATAKITKEQFNKMSYSERKQLYTDNVDLYRELAE